MTADNHRQSAESEKATVLLVDDVPLERFGLSHAIDESGDMKVCARARNVQEALASLAEHKPELMTIDLKAGSLLRLIETVKADSPETKILAISMMEESFIAERAIHAGASGFISKTQQVEEIMRALRVIRRGEVYLSQETSDVVVRRMMHGESDAGPPIGTLSNRELEIFQFFGEGLTSREIAERLNLSARTVETHRDNIRKKLNLENPSQLIRFAAQWNLYMEGREEAL